MIEAMITEEILAAQQNNPNGEISGEELNLILQKYGTVNYGEDALTITTDKQIDNIEFRENYTIEITGLTTSENGGFSFLPPLVSGTDSTSGAPGYDYRTEINEVISKLESINASMPSSTQDYSSILNTINDNLPSSPVNYSTQLNNIVNGISSLSTGSSGQLVDDNWNGEVLFWFEKGINKLTATASDGGTFEVPKNSQITLISGLNTTKYKYIRIRCRYGSGLSFLSGSSSGYVPNIERRGCWRSDPYE